MLSERIEIRQPLTHRYEANRPAHCPPATYVSQRYGDYLNSNKEVTTVKIFRIDHIKIAPLTIIAPDNPSAADLFVMSIAMGIGNIPDATWEITEWRPKTGGKNGSLRALAMQKQSGFAYPTPDGWKIFPPYRDL